MQQQMLEQLQKTFFENWYEKTQKETDPKRREEEYRIWLKEYKQYLWKQLCDMNPYLKETDMP